MSEMLQPGSPEINKLTDQLQSLGGAGVPPLTGFDAGSLLGGMTMTVIIVNLIAGLVGTVYFMKGKKASNISMMVSGILLCVLPYFIKNAPALIVVCVVLAVAPFVIERYVDL